MNGAAQTVAIADVQALILRGFGRLAASCYLTLRFDNAAGARAWLGDVAEEVTSAAVPLEANGRYLNLAFTRSGLERLGVPADTLAIFRSAFHGGAAGTGQPPTHRSQALGDVGDSAPERWRWGNSDHPIDAVLLLFAGASDIEPFTQFHRDRLDKHGVVVLGAYPDVPLVGRKEHFGFRDGISQPAVRNANPETERPGVLEGGATNPVEPGEFLFGYRNQYGAIANPGSPDLLDFARNGSFMVWRQLEEDVQEFWRAIQENADDDRTARRALAAKFFGRWPSGAPLALAPEIEDRSLEDANDFTYAADPYGFLTPFGSHIRRGNPRDWHVAPTTEKAIEVSNKHRIIRRGRPYGPPVAASMDPEDILHTPSAEADRNERGVHFVCFMTDIERQFEMIQSAWLNDSTFAGLYAEVDPMLGTPLAAGGALTVQATPIRRRLLGLSRFVTVRGAAYLFVPSLETVRSLVARRGD